MSKEKIIVIGDGNQAEVVIDIIHSQKNYKIIGVTSQDNTLDKFCGYPVLGDDSKLLEIKKNTAFKLAMGIGGYRNQKKRVI